MPKISVGFVAFTNANTQRLILRAELSASYLKAQVDGVAPAFEVRDYTLQTYHLDQYTLSLTPN